MNATSQNRAVRVVERGTERVTDLHTHLDDLLSRLRHGDTRAALAMLIELLNRVRLTATEDEWVRVCSEVCRSHAIFQVLQEDPYVARAFNKPRGYAGDAVMMDYIYDPASVSAPARGRRLLRATSRSPNSQSVVWRRDLLASEIDRTAAEVPGARILAVACGHLREATLSAAVHSGDISELVALDQDRESIDVVRRECLKLPVTPVHGSVAQIIRGELELGKFDFIYAAGLYDYLDDRAAQALSHKLLSHLRPGGQLLIGNFMPANDGRAFMEAFMDWHLICRTTADLELLSKSVSEENSELFTDPWQNVAYVRMRAPARLAVPARAAA